jgi:UrcA family protein
MEIRSRLCSLALCALAGSVLPLAASQVASAANAQSAAVSYRDLDLSKPADARVFYLRLQRAAENVCMAPPTYELERHAAYVRCVQVTLRDTVARVNSTALAQVAAELGHGGDLASNAQPVR